MISTLANIETDTIRDWLKLYSEVATEFKTSYTGIAPTLVPGSTTIYTLPHYNILPTTLVASNAAPVISYRPSEGDKIVSKIVMGAPLPVGATFSYTANTVRFVIRENDKRALQPPPEESPRFYVLHTKDIPLVYRRQVDDIGQRVTGRRLFLSLLIDVDEKLGGPLEKNRLAGLVQQVLEKRENMDYLFLNGYENIKFRSVNYFSPEQEKVVGVYRGSILISTDVYPRIF